MHAGTSETMNDLLRHIEVEFVAKEVQIYARRHDNALPTINQC